MGAKQAGQIIARSREPFLDRSGRSRGQVERESPPPDLIPDRAALRLEREGRRRNGKMLIEPFGDARRRHTTAGQAQSDGDELILGKRRKLEPFDLAEAVIGDLSHTSGLIGRGQHLFGSPRGVAKQAREQRLLFRKSIHIDLHCLLGGARC